MNTLKEKVSNQLSFVFSNSAKSSPASPRSPNDDNSQASTPSTRKSFSSFVSAVLPPVRIGWPRSNRQRRMLTSTSSLPSDFDIDLLPGEEYSARYYDCLTSVDEDFLNSCEDEKRCKMASESKKTFEAHVASLERSKSDGEVFSEALDQLTAQKLDDSDFISAGLYEFLLSSLPNSVKGLQWVLIYSTLRDGISLRTLIRKSAGFSGPCLLIVGDRQGAIFGGLLECPLRSTGKRKYQGSNETFVFTTLYDQPRLFRATGANRYYYICLNDLLAFGGGENFALRLDEDLLNGSSGPSETFGNECLAHGPEFELKNVELWGFTYSSRYLADRIL